MVSFHDSTMPARIRNAQRASGLTPSCSPALSWLLMFAFGVNVLCTQMELNMMLRAIRAAQRARRFRCTSRPGQAGAT
jgi:hypothetical protein